jgi:transcriptional regulator with XRE-family HTH domain
MAGFDLSGALRRIRRTADLSQRELADALGVSQTAVARAEAGHRDWTVGSLVQAAGLAGLHMALADDTGAAVEPMIADGVRDRAGRRFPAHLDTRHGDEDWWHGEERYSRPAPDWTYDGRHLRDFWRERRGTPDDHHQPGPGDSLVERAEQRRQRADQARRDRTTEHARRAAAGEVEWPREEPCTCQPGCDELLEAGELVVPHVAACPCRCDVA